MINANSHIRNISTYHENNVIKNISWKGKSLLPLGKAEVLEKIPEKCLKRLLKTEISCVIHKLTFIVRQSQARIKEEEHATSILRWTQDLNRWPSWENSAPWWLLSVPKMIDYIPLSSIPLQSLLCGNLFVSDVFLQRPSSANTHNYFNILF